MRCLIEKHEEKYPTFLSCKETRDRSTRTTTTRLGYEENRLTIVPVCRASLGLDDSTTWHRAIAIPKQLRCRCPRPCTCPYAGTRRENRQSACRNSYVADEHRGLRQEGASTVSQLHHQEFSSRISLHSVLQLLLCTRKANNGVFRKVRWKNEITGCALAESGMAWLAGAWLARLKLHAHFSRCLRPRKWNLQKRKKRTSCVNRF